MKRKIRKDRVFFITLLLLVIMAMPTIVRNETIRRGYFAIGGEWLIIPIICIVWRCTESLRGEIMKHNKELIEREENMEYTGQKYRDLFVKTKIEGFVNSQYQFKATFENYKGHVLSEHGYKQKAYFDFLCEMKQFGIERDEIEQAIIRDYLIKKEEQ